jgi:uncharacterized membrane protein
MIKLRRILLTACAVAVLGGCAGMSETEQRGLTGTAGGAAGGALIGAMAGNAGLGAVAGAGAGLLGGLLFDYHKQTEQRAYQQGVHAGRSGG